MLVPVRLNEFTGSEDQARQATHQVLWIKPGFWTSHYEKKTLIPNLSDSAAEQSF